MSANFETDLLTERKVESIATSISDRQSTELVIALVGPVGSGVSTAARLIQEILESEFDYKVCPTIKPSDFIKTEAKRVGLTIPSAQPLDDYITAMQSAGNELRQRFGNNYLVEKAVEKIHTYRVENGGLSEDKKSIVPCRFAYIIDSLKNPEEFLLLRQIYGNSLCVFGIFAPDEIRSDRLKDIGVVENSIKKIMDRDSGEVVTFGQKTRKLFCEADFFVRNDRKIDDLRVTIRRYLSICFESAIHTPKRAESAMYEASAASAGSACMSRQVGAAIVSRTGELIGVGWNDVPKFGGGLYTEDDQFSSEAGKSGFFDADFRCFKWGGKICHNETKRVDIIENIIDKIFRGNVLKRNKKKEDIRALLGETEIDSLIEFSRSIHAEMEAILSVAREGKHSLKGATLYTTVYPCHNCARHIVASGITKVVYIEPYDKSLAVELHNDAVTENPDHKTKVIFSQYAGVAPQNYLKLFRTSADRKKDGGLIVKDPKHAFPHFRVPLDSFLQYEFKVVSDLASKEDTPL